ncbi:Arc-like DNA binding dprotein [Neorhizobium sp. R1-B]|uniref:Arc family DNA-binding protein n=1 Tax=Neorhizobium sp. R1-B TaxID=2485162 RepID=UPI0010662275|nr:Arc family DNA-binding protein [Neorhizobium sp. R1-B]TDX88473.1 Arc-like DNA binding dprotein [Neorhizobium sp. R1-B]
MSNKKTPEEKIGSIAPFGLRMLPELKQRVEAAAQENNRSMNAEIVARLEASFTNLHLTDGKVTAVTIPKRDFDYLMSNIEEINRKMKLYPESND